MHDIIKCTSRVLRLLDSPNGLHNVSLDYVNTNRMYDNC